MTRFGLIHAYPPLCSALGEWLGAIPGFAMAWETIGLEAAIRELAAAPIDLIVVEVSSHSPAPAKLVHELNCVCPSSIVLLAEPAILNDGVLVAAALQCGAVAVLAAPASAESEAFAELGASLSRVAEALGGGEQHDAPSCAPTLVVVGASAGGPAAVKDLLSSIPPNGGTAIVIVQHLDARFSPTMAQWLAGESMIPVRLARHGEAPSAGVALLAGGAYHLRLNSRQRLVYDPDPAGLIHRPSIDVFFKSVAANWRQRAIGVLLTGMGGDGARGLLALRNQSHHTIAQDEDSSAVAGMPLAAMRLQAAAQVLPLSEIAQQLH